MLHIARDEQGSDRELEKKKKKKRGTKNFSLMSFGEEAEEAEVADAEAATTVGKVKSSHDVLADPQLSSKTAVLEDEAAIEALQEK